MCRHGKNVARQPNAGDTGCFQFFFRQAQKMLSSHEYLDVTALIYLCAKKRKKLISSRLFSRVCFRKGCRFTIHPTFRKTVLRRTCYQRHLHIGCTIGDNVLENDLLALFPQVKTLALERLCVRTEDQIEALLLNFPFLSSLENLDLSGCEPSSPTMKRILQACLTLPNLRYLKLSHPSFQKPDANNFTKYLKVFDVTRFSFTYFERAAILATCALSSLGNLRKVQIRGFTSLYKETAEPLVRALAKLPFLQAISLDIPLFVETLFNFYGTSESHLRSLQWFRYYACYLNGKKAQMLGRWLRGSPLLDTLQILGNYAPLNVIGKLAAEFATFKQLSFLDLGPCKENNPNPQQLFDATQRLFGVFPSFG